MVEMMVVVEEVSVLDRMLVGRNIGIQKLSPS